MLIMQISTQTNNHNYRSVAAKNVYPLKMGLKFQNPKFNILHKTAFIFLYEMPALWSSEVSVAILEQVNYDYMYCD